jgi:hypothetical protein
MRVMRWNWDLIHETRTEALNGADGCPIVRVTGNRDGLINGTDEGRNGPTSLKGIAVTARRLANLVSDVPGSNSNMRGIADAEIDVPDIRAILH